MECLWCLYCYWQPHGHCYQPHPPIFYVRLITHSRFSHYHLYGTGLLEKYEEVYMGREAEPVVLPVVSSEWLMVKGIPLCVFPIDY
jgi:hypothetical protein